MGRYVYSKTLEQELFRIGRALGEKFNDIILNLITESCFGRPGSISPVEVYFQRSFQSRTRAQVSCYFAGVPPRAIVFEDASEAEFVFLPGIILVQLAFDRKELPELDAGYRGWRFRRREKEYLVPTEKRT
jgi:hypothetical protein